jgi:chromosome segregation ATPase
MEVFHREAARIKNMADDLNAIRDRMDPVSQEGSHLKAKTEEANGQVQSLIAKTTKNADRNARTTQRIEALEQQLQTDTENIGTEIKNLRDRIKNSEQKLGKVDELNAKIADMDRFKAALRSDLEADSARRFGEIRTRFAELRKDTNWLLRFAERVASDFEDCRAATKKVADDVAALEASVRDRFKTVTRTANEHYQELLSKVAEIVPLRQAQDRFAEDLSENSAALKAL